MPVLQAWIGQFCCSLDPKLYFVYLMMAAVFSDFGAVPSIN